MVVESDYCDAPQVFSRIVEYCKDRGLTREVMVEMFASVARAMARESYDEGTKQ